MQKTLTRTQRPRREDIVHAAIIVINREGYAAASVDKIAKEAVLFLLPLPAWMKVEQLICNALLLITAILLFRR